MTLAQQVEALSRRSPSRDVPSSTRLPTAGRASPPAPLREDLARAVAEADAVAMPVRDLGPYWQDVLDGRTTFYAQGTTASGRYVLLRKGAGLVISESRVKRIEIAMLVRVLTGEQQKSVALDMGIACSTASKWYTSGLKKLRLDGERPLPLILAAQTWSAGAPQPVAARETTIDHGGERFVFLVVPAPNLDAERLLTRAERAVAKDLIDGMTRWEIAALRKTSTQTVACQLRGIFQKLRVTGRCELIKRGVGDGWFR
jgi:DNA-binding CsgD family transcriptional regulator